MRYGGITFKRNPRGGIIAPKPGGYERDYGPARYLFTHPVWGYKPAVKWAERQKAASCRSPAAFA